MRNCRTCLGEFPFKDFQQDKTKRDGISSQCKVCFRKYLRDRRASDPEKSKKDARDYYAMNREKIIEKNSKSRKRNWPAYKNRNLMVKFGIGLKEYAEMFDEQGGLCAICKREEMDTNKSGERKALAVDHDHETGKIRGLLCSNCNKGLGNLQDNSRFLEGAAKYLKDSGTDKRFFYADFTGVKEEQCPWNIERTRLNRGEGEL